MCSTVSGNLTDCDRFLKSTLEYFQNPTPFSSVSFGLLLPVETALPPPPLQQISLILFGRRQWLSACLPVNQTMSPAGPHGVTVVPPKLSQRERERASEQGASPPYSLLLMQILGPTALAAPLWMKKLRSLLGHWTIEHAVAAGTSASSQSVNCDPNHQLHLQPVLANRCYLSAGATLSLCWAWRTPQQWRGTTHLRTKTRQQHSRLEQIRTDSNFSCLFLLLYSGCLALQWEKCAPCISTKIFVLSTSYIGKKNHMLVTFVLKVLKICNTC